MSLMALCMMMDITDMVVCTVQCGGGSSRCILHSAFFDTAFVLHTSGYLSGGGKQACTQHGGGPMMLVGGNAAHSADKYAAFIRLFS